MCRIGISLNDDIAFAACVFKLRAYHIVVDKSGSVTSIDEQFEWIVVHKSADADDLERGGEGVVKMHEWYVYYLSIVQNNVRRTQ